MYDLDPIDRKIVAALQANGRASWTEISPLVGTSVTTVARRAQQLFADGLVRVAAVPHTAGEEGADMLVVRLRCTPGSQIAVGQAIAALPQVRFVAVVTGAYDLVAEVVVPKGGALHTLLVNGVQQVPGVQRSVADLELHTYKSTHEWSRQLLGEAAANAAAPPPPVRNCQPGHLDTLDEKILDALRIDGRASFQAVAAGLGVSESTVRRRFEALHHSGCVQVITLIPAAALGFEKEMFFWLSVAPNRLEAVAAELAAQRGVRYVAATLGQESLMCEVILPTHRDVYEFTSCTLAGIEGIQAWTANVQLLTLKRGFVQTPWSQQA
ncbi:MAG TPA: AsnC family transcriptional regulator [Candidatus Limnocylindrales bacterium]